MLLRSKCYHPTNLDTFFYQDWLDGNVIFGTPFNLHAVVTTNLLEHAGFNDNMIYARSEIVNNHQCYHTSASPITTDWTTAYSNDISTNIMLSMFKSEPKPVWSMDLLQHIEVAYCSSLKVHIICMLQGKTVLYKVI